MSKPGYITLVLEISFFRRCAIDEHPKRSPRAVIDGFLAPLKWAIVGQIRAASDTVGTSRRASATRGLACGREYVLRTERALQTGSISIG